MQVFGTYEREEEEDDDLQVLSARQFWQIVKGRWQLSHKCKYLSPKLFLFYSSVDLESRSSEKHNFSFTTALYSVLFSIYVYICRDLPKILQFFAVDYFNFL